MEQKIEAVARALCKLDGKDPDQSTRMRGGSPGFHSFAGKTEADLSPLWKTYEKEAERFVVAAEALRPLLNSIDIGRW